MGNAYRNPPVVEALCEVFFAGSAWDDTVPGRFYDQLQERFPVKRQREIQEAQVSLSSAGEASAAVRRLAPRIQFLSKKEDRMVQLGKDLLVVNQLRPYPSFEDWEPVVHEMIGIYRELAKPREVEKVGVRYINRVMIPGAKVRMEDYFTIYPQLPKAMGDLHGPFMVRVEVPAGKGKHVTLITFGTAPSEQAAVSAYLLDLYDILKPARELTAKDLQREVRAAHDHIERAFEGSITDHLRDVFGRKEAP